MNRTRTTYRCFCVARRECRGCHFDATTNSIAHTYDRLHRLTVRNADRFAYNRRGEVASATVAGESSAYAYDGIGNFTTVTGGAITNVYSANELNQYEVIPTATSDP